MKQKDELEFIGFIYLLWNNVGQVVYVGCTVNDLYSRISSHNRSKSFWNSTYYKCYGDCGDLKIMERQLIFRFNPYYNRKIPIVNIDDVSPVRWLHNKIWCCKAEFQYRYHNDDRSYSGDCVKYSSGTLRLKPFNKYSLIPLVFQYYVLHKTFNYYKTKYRIKRMVSNVKYRIEQMVSNVIDNVKYRIERMKQIKVKMEFHNYYHQFQFELNFHF